MKKRNSIQKRIRRSAENSDRVRQRRHDALMRAVESLGYSADGVKISDTVDMGRGGRRTSKPRRDEISATGEFSGSRSGFGFVTVEGEERDIFIPEGRCLGAIDGDTVEVVYHRYRSYSGDEKTEGRVVRIVKCARSVLVGCFDIEISQRRYGKKCERAVFIPDDGKIPFTPTVKNPEAASLGHKVAVKLLRNSDTYHECEIIADLGAPETREANYSAVLIESGIPTEFSAEELALAEEMAAQPIDYERRRSLVDECILTIDGAGAKDLDDAISLKRLDCGWRLSVHIADVSHYVPEKSALDRCAMARGTSVYFVDKVVPMLPEALSNGACSLNAGEDKCALTAEIMLSPDGEITSCEVYKSVIRSRVRGVYSEVNRLLDGEGDGAVLEKYSDVKDMLLEMRELYLVLLLRATRRGMLDLDLPEAKISLDGEGMPVDISVAERGISERIIEQFMITANEAVARLLREEGLPGVYRTHAAPPVEKLRDFLRYASNLGLDISGVSPDSPTQTSLGGIIEEAKEEGVGYAVSYMMLRSMAKAEYTPTPDGHFGIGLADYCHFTSPIRRLSDLAVHRIISRTLIGGKRGEAYQSYARRAARAASDAEVRAIHAERKIEDLYKVLYMKERIGEIFDATVSSAHSFGIFVELDNTVEGLVPIEDMPGYFIYDEKNMAVRSSKLVYRTGDRVRVRLEDADLANCKLRFSLLLGETL